MKNDSIIEVMGCCSTKYGGVEKFIIELIKANPLLKFYVVYDETPKSRSYLKDLKEFGAEVLIIDTRGFSFITNTIKFFKLVNRVNPVIVHFHFSLAFCIWGPICKLQKVKYLYKTVHGCLFFHNKQVYDIKDTTLKHRLITRDGNIYKIFDNIFCVSNFVKNQFDKVYMKKGKTKVVYVGTKTPIFISEDQKNELKQRLNIDNQFLILTIAFANPIKGCDIFVRSLSKIKHKDFIAIIVGMDEKEPYTLEIMKIANELGVDEHIRWIGITDEVYKYMNISNVFVQSSRTEGLSLAATEAASFSLPIVATNTGGLPEVTSVLFPYEDFNKLAIIIDRLIEDKEECKKLSDLSYRRWEKLFRIERGVRLYTEFYNNSLTNQ